MRATAGATAAVTANPGRAARPRSANSRTASDLPASSPPEPPGSRQTAPDGASGGGRARRPHRLAHDAEGLAAGGQDPQVRALAEQAVGQVGGVGDHVLAVVEDEQEAAGPQRRRQPPGRTVARLAPRRWRCPGQRAASTAAARSAPGRAGPARPATRRPACPPPAGATPRPPAGSCPTPPGPQRHQPVLAHHLAHPDQVAVAPDEAGQRSAAGSWAAPHRPPAAAGRGSRPGPGRAPAASSPRRTARWRAESSADGSVPRRSTRRVRVSS